MAQGSKEPGFEVDQVFSYIFFLSEKLCWDLVDSMSGVEVYSFVLSGDQLDLAHPT